MVLNLNTANSLRILAAVIKKIQFRYYILICKINEKRIEIAALKSSLLRPFPFPFSFLMTTICMYNVCNPIK